MLKALYQLQKHRGITHIDHDIIICLILFCLIRLLELTMNIFLHVFMCFSFPSFVTVNKNNETSQTLCPSY